MKVTVNLTQGEIDLLESWYGSAAIGVRIIVLKWMKDGQAEATTGSEAEAVAGVADPGAVGPADRGIRER